MRFGNDVVAALDEAVRASVTGVAATGLPVYYVAPVHQAVLPNHTACDDEPYINGADVVQGAVRLVGDGLVGGLPGTAPQWSQELLHPNADGYSAVTNALVTWSQGQGPAPVPTAPAATSAPVPLARASSPATRVVLSGTGTTTIRVAAGSAVDVTVTGVAADMPVTIVVRSSPRAVGSLMSGPDGVASGVVYVPAGLAPGVHTLEASGFDPNGDVLVHSQQLTVLPARPWWFVPVAAGAAAAVIGAGALLVIRRRTTAA